MKTLTLRKGGAVLIEQVEPAYRLGGRMRGLLRRDRLAPGHGLHLAPCSAVHTWGMRFTIDLVFLSRGFTIVRIRKNVVPYRMVFGGSGVYSVLEFQSGWFAWDRVGVGDRVALE